jgi:hypothetical protein
MQLKKLVKDYAKDEIVRKVFKYLKFLPFVPTQDVINAFKKIRQLAETCTKLKQMLVYFETFYIGKLIRGSTTVRKLPMYPIKQWNVVSRILNEKGKTNNSLESFCM